MAVAISTVGGTSVGYGGTITEDNLSTWALLTGGAQYGVMNPGDWKVTAVAAGDRMVQIAPGINQGFGVYDTLPTGSALQLQLPAVTPGAGSRYDIVVARRDWSGSGGTTYLDRIAATTSGDIPATRAKRFPTPTTLGTTDEQPLALVQMVEGSSVPVVVADLRVWQANGGAVANSDKVLQFLDGPGTSVVIGQDRWTRTVDSGTGIASWSSSRMGGVDLFGTGSPLAGVIDGSARFKMQAGSTVTKTDASGYARITFPNPFPNGLIAFLPANGDGSVDRAAGEALVFAVAGGSPFGVGTRTDVVLTVEHARGTGTGVPFPGVNVRCNWLAIGW